MMRGRSQDYGIDIVLTKKPFDWIQRSLREGFTQNAVSGFPNGRGKRSRSEKRIKGWRSLPWAVERIRGYRLRRKEALMA